MNKQTIALLRSSFSEIKRRRPDVAAVFFKRLFEVAPALRRAFKGAAKDEQRELTEVLGQIVASLDHSEALTGHLTRLGQRHAALKARPTHYRLAGDTLMWTFEQVLKRDFTAPLRAAWMQAYAAMAKTMLAAGEPVAVAAVEVAKPKRKPVVRRAASTAAGSGKRKAARRPATRKKPRTR
ncbi:MAG TPA: globin domain-containing protein [Polyangiales bacterium]|jgi:hemoglobin-like flavoprotein|nr:globin domain-containing protein [Polyangiales bacterium]